MTKLLVSVRSANEAQAALDGGADWIDIKEPNRGPLGTPDASTIVDVLQTVRGRVPVSAAFGELADRFDLSNNSPLARRPSALPINKEDPSYPSPPGFAGGEGRVREDWTLALAKIGMKAAGPHWRENWQSWSRLLPPNCDPVIVIYAEGALVASPSPNKIIDFALRVSPAAVLIDTARKDSQTLLDHWPTHQLAELLLPLRLGGIPFALAGSLRFEQIDDLLPLNPGWIAVRGAVCTGGRNGVVSSELVAQWKAEISRKSSPTCRISDKRVPSHAGL
jgi:uncharacterized protein (UPF0264 family)